MSQRDVLEQMGKDRWITSEELALLIPFLNRTTIQHSLARLEKIGLIKSRRDDNCGHGYKYKVKN